MRILAVSDMHLDDASAEALLAAAPAADLVLGAGDFATQHRGLDTYMARLAPIASKAVYVPGNNESLAALRDATDATVLHADVITREGVTIAGLGGGIPPLPPLPWHSWDLTEEAAAEALSTIASADILLLHSPPAGLGDNHSSLGHIGSVALKAALLRIAPRLCLFGHVHDCWGQSGRLGPTAWRNVGPRPVWLTL